MLELLLANARPIRLPSPFATGPKLLVRVTAVCRKPLGCDATLLPREGEVMSPGCADAGIGGMGKSLDEDVEVEREMEETEALVVVTQGGWSM